MSNDHVNYIKKMLETIKGVEKAFILDDLIKKKIVELENEANGKVLMGMGIGDNQGIKTAFQKKWLVVIITNKYYKWPNPPNVIMKQNDVIIGFDCSEEDLQNYSKNEKYSVFGTFVMMRDKIPNATGKPVVVLPPKNFDQLNELCPNINAVVASPSTPSDEYLHKIFGVEQKKGNGTVIVGFD